MITATMAGYAFARLRFPGRDLAFSLVLFQMMVPNQVFFDSAVFDGFQDGNVKYDFCSGFPGTGYRLWNLSFKTGLYGTSQGFGGGCQTGWL